MEGATNEVGVTNRLGEDRVLTHYFRTTFEVHCRKPDLRLRNVVDDGAVFYLNGVEIDRVRMAEPGPVAWGIWLRPVSEWTNTLNMAPTSIPL